MENKGDPKKRKKKGKRGANSGEVLWPWQCHLSDRTRAGRAWPAVQSGVTTLSSPVLAFQGLRHRDGQCGMIPPALRGRGVGRENGTTNGIPGHPPPPIPYLMGWGCGMPPRKCLEETCSKKRARFATRPHSRRGLLMDISHRSSASSEGKEHMPV